MTANADGAATRMGLPAMPSFEAFYTAVNGGRPPFPWQRRLAAHVRDNGRWPAEIGIPTGLGKTACLDVAIWWLASDAVADASERAAPTRIWWVVNRRLLVDSTHLHAQRIAGLLRDPAAATGDGAADVVADVATRLSHVAGTPDALPLQVVQLRGGVAPTRPRHPAQPTVILSTVPMYGSRLLFRGYGSSRSMRPIDAAHAGIDTLVLVDEAHLATHLMRLVPALAECTPDSTPPVAGSRSAPQVVSLTATGEAETDRFELDEADREHNIVRQRLDAPKRLELREPSGANPPKHLASVAVSLLSDADRPSSCVVFANTPACARAAYGQITDLARRRIDPPCEVVLLTGRNREHDAQRIRDRILHPQHGAPASGNEAPRERSLIVVATQTLEVGADVDFEFLVTEQCGVRALIQRLGRLNRLGRFGDSRAVYVHTPPPKGRGRGAAEWPVYGTEPNCVLSRLQQAEGFEDGIDVSPRHVAAVLGEAQDDPGRAPEVLPALMWEWVKTTTPPAGEAPVEPFFSGIADPDRSVSVVWRCHVPRAGQRLWPRPRSAEAVEIPLRDLREVVADDERLLRLGVDGITLEELRPSRLRPGDTIVLRADRGLLDEFGWSPDSTEVVADLSLLDSGLPLDADALRLLCGAEVGSEIARALQLDSEEPDENYQESAIVDLLEALGDCVPRHLAGDNGTWHGFLTALDRRPAVVEGEVARLVLTSSSRGVSHYDELDEASLAPSAVELDQHGAEVGAAARCIADALGIEPSLGDIVELAGDCHDLGKADERFQRWLRGGEPGELLLAKSQTPRTRWAAARVASGWPQGGRHEELSARLVQAWLDRTDQVAASRDADLLLHLVVSHHGKGRPLLLPAADGTTATVKHRIGDVAVSANADLSLADWGQPERFGRLNDWFGPWGLALLEAVIRQADHLVSAGAAEADDWELR